MKQQSINFKVNTIYLAVMTALLSSTAAYAQQTDETNQSEEPTVVLEAVTVENFSRLGRKSTEITGLGKIVKHAKDIDEEQIMGMRDLTRYDPGISVVEQGRGATSGYSIRGVDKNRVGLQVDGLVQAQSYITEHSDANGGAINEIEYENVRSIELSKGSASAEFGSGALGGAVSFRTKEPKDIIKEGQNWGINAKTAYSSKNNQHLNTVGVAGRAGNFEGLLQFTHRKGNEIEAHKDVKDIPQSITRVGAFATPYELRPAPWNSAGEAEILKSAGWFVLKEECPTLTNCTPKPKAEMTQEINTRHTPRSEPPYTPKEQAIYDSMGHIVEQVGSEQYTGENRALPNPMDYESESLFFKGGYHIDDKHYLGAVIERTKQEYDVQDKTKPAYLSLKELKDNHGRGSVARGLYTKDNIHEGVVLDILPFRRTAMYTHGVYYDENHDKSRYGVTYRYKNSDKQGVMDNLSLSFDRQDISLDTFLHEHRCSDYPNFDKDCLPSADKPWSSYYSHRNQYEEIHNVWQLTADKRLKFANMAHELNFLAGVDDFKSNLYRGDYLGITANGEWKSLGGNGTYEDPDIYERLPTQVVATNYCQAKGIGLAQCGTRTITGQNQFIALRDHIEMNKYLKLGLGARYDHHTFKSDDKYTGTGKFSNWSYNAGLTINPTDNIALSYRYSNAFRVPAFYELFGRRGSFDPNNPISHEQQYVSDLKPEKATNQEFGIGLMSELGYLEISHFTNNYKDLIVAASRRPDLSQPATDDGYHNVHDIDLKGINVLGKIDWYSVWNRLPDGLYSTFAYNKIKVKNANAKEGFVFTSTPLLDTLQPARYVAGVGYDDPDDKWGINLMATYSEAKDTEELLGQQKGGYKNHVAATKFASKHWYTYDLTGFWNLNDNFTVRAGIYNLLNRKYSTWEAIRQSSVNAVNPETSNNVARYAAPGRNFNVALEMKF